MDAVIIGNSRAAIEATQVFRRHDDESQFTIISKEDHLSYHRPLIAEYLSGEKSYEDILATSPGFYRELNVELMKGVEVAALDANRKEILLDQNHRIQYDRLLIASGSKPIIPSIPGVTLGGVHTFWTIEDAKAISEQTANAESAIVIGAGLIGISAIYALHELGLKVTAVEMLNRVLTPSLDVQGSRIIQRRMKQLGIDIYLKRKVVEIKSETASGFVSSVRLDNEAEIPCQVVVVAAGVRPNVDFLRESSLNIEQGIIVNEYLETSVPGIYAAGDVTQPYDLVRNENAVIANLHNASEQGRIAGANLAGQKLHYRGGLAMTSIRYFGIPFVSMGVLSKLNDRYEEISIANSDMSIYRKLVISDGKPVGAVLVGDIDQAGIVMHLIREEIPVRDPRDLLERKLEFEEFRKELMREKMEGAIQWKKTIGLEEPWRKKRERILISK